MLYNKDLKRVIRFTDCLNCEHFDKRLKVCQGANKVCFEYDEKTQTCIDGITKKPIKFI